MATRICNSNPVSSLCCGSVERVGHGFEAAVEEVSRIAGVSLEKASEAMTRTKWADINEAILECVSRKSVPDQRHRAVLTATVGECITCCDEKRLIGLHSCGHCICMDCWDRFAQARLSEAAGEISCPVCSEAIAVETGKLLLRGDTLSHFVRIRTGARVDQSSCLAWCRKAGCGNVVTREEGQWHGECSCGEGVCFKCSLVDHRPASCEQYALWESEEQQHSMQDLASSSWIDLNTKPCPKCLVPIQKNQGCPHMNCAHCRCSFCWKCGQRWNSHSVSECSEGKYQEIKARAKKEYRNPDDDCKLLSVDLFMKVAECHKLVHSLHDKRRKSHWERPLNDQWMKEAIAVCIKGGNSLKFATLRNGLEAKSGAKSEGQELQVFAREQLEASIRRVCSLTESEPDQENAQQWRKQVAGATTAVQMWRCRLLQG